MVTIRYKLTSNDLAEIERERQGGFPRQVLRILFGAAAGFMGFFLVWQATLFFAWNRPSANLTFIGFGLLLVWCGFEAPGLNWLVRQFSDPFAEREIRVYDGKVITLCKGKSWQFRWLPRRGFKETRKFFLLSALKSDGGVRIPKHAVTPEQEHSLREFVEAEPVAGSPIECSFFLTQGDLNEARVARHPWLGSKHGDIVSRLVLVMLAIFLPTMFWIIRNSSKPDLQQLTREPVITACLVPYELLLVWGATGYIGKKSLYSLHRERRMQINNLEIATTRGSRTRAHSWKCFLGYQETANLFVLRARFTIKFVIPKRALRSGDEERLRALLWNHLPDTLSSL